MKIFPSIPLAAQDFLFLHSRAGKRQDPNFKDLLVKCCPQHSDKVNEKIFLFDNGGEYHAHRYNV
jgi:hypothetical protein